jgi:flagellar biogenesis protein FliO
MRLASQNGWWLLPMLIGMSVCIVTKAQAQNSIDGFAPESAAAGPSDREPASPSSTTYQVGSVSPTILSEPADAPLDKGRRFIRSTPRGEKSAHPAGQRSNNMLSNWAKGSGATALAALAFVVGLFTLFAWVMKRSMPKSAQVLPAEAVRILGRVPLGGRQFGQLLHLGNKLVLVHVTQAGVEKLAEIDEPSEVVRLLAICSKNSKGSQKEFEEIFGQFAKEKTEPGFLGSEGSLFTAGNSKGGRYA